MVEHTFGTRAQVWHGTAKKTSGGLMKSALMMNKHGRIVSRKKHNTAKRENRLLKHGYGTKKGKFGAVKLSKSRKMRGGSGMLPLNPTDSNSSYMIKDVFPQEFSPNDLALVGGRRRRHRRSSMRGGTMDRRLPLAPSAPQIAALRA